MSDSELDRTLVHPDQAPTATGQHGLAETTTTTTTTVPTIGFNRPHAVTFLQQQQQQLANHPPSTDSSAEPLQQVPNQRYPQYFALTSGDDPTVGSDEAPSCLLSSDDQHGCGGGGGGGGTQLQRPLPVAFARHLPATHSTISRDNQPKRISTSLPLYYAKSDLCTLGSRPGMEYVPLRTPATEPYHYHHVTDQTKSLQELQNEVGALLEFRDLVIETFPDLKSKMASSTTNSTLTGLPSSSSLAARREWEPGIRIRRKLTQKDGAGGGGGALSSGCSIGALGSGGGGGVGLSNVAGTITAANSSSGSSGSSTTIIPGSGGGCVGGSGTTMALAGHQGASAPAAAGSSNNSNHNNNNTTSSSCSSDLNHLQQQQQQHSHQHHPPHHHHYHHHSHSGGVGGTGAVAGTGAGAGVSNSSSTSSSGGSNSNNNSSGHHHHHAQHQPAQPVQHHSSSSLIRSRSNSHSGKKEPKSGEGNNGSVIQDSGFSTETSSSKETHSAASSTSGAVLQGTSSSTSANNRLAPGQENELWNLLDVIHRKSNRLREELDALPLLQRGGKLRGSNLTFSNQSAAAGVASTVPAAAAAAAAVATSSGGTSSAAAALEPLTIPEHPHQSSHSGSNIVIHHSNPAAVVALGGSATSGANVTVLATGSATDGGQHGKTAPPPHYAAETSQAVAMAAAKDHIVQILRQERDRLLDKLSSYEAETVAGRIRAAKMQDEVETLTLTVRKLHEQLKAAQNQQLELNTKLHDLHQQPVNKSASSSSDTAVQQGSSSGTAQQTAFAKAPRYHATVLGPAESSSSGNVSTSTVIISAATASSGALDDTTCAVTGQGTGAGEANAGRSFDASALGRLDALLGTPSANRLQKVRSLDSQKIAAILLETNIVELQRHLLTVTVQNQVLQQRLEQATRSKIFLSEKLEKSKEDVDDLRFQLKEKTIELEGTRAQLRVIESKASSKSSPASATSSPDHHHQRLMRMSSPTMMLPQQQQQQQQHQQSTTLMHLTHTPSGALVGSNCQLVMRLASSQVSTPSMKAMTPVVMDDIAQQQQHSSSTESAQDQAERDSTSSGTGGRMQPQQQQQQQQQQYHHHHNHQHHHQQQQLQCPDTPRRRPSKIPLPGMKGSVAPKPPSGRNFAAAGPTTPTTPTGVSTSASHRPLALSSGPPSNRSLAKSTGSLYIKSSDVGPFGATQQQQHQQQQQQQHQPQPMNNKPRDSNSSGSSGSLYRPDSAQSWRTSKDTPSLEKSRSSSIPISSGKGGQQSPATTAHAAIPLPRTPTAASPSMIPSGPIGGGGGFGIGSTISSSPQPRSKRDSLTTKVKNCDSLSRLQSAQMAGSVNKTTGTKNSATGSGTAAGSGYQAPPPPVRERKQSAGVGLRHASSSSIGSATDGGTAIGSGNGTGNTSASTTTTTTTTIAAASSSSTSTSDTIKLAQQPHRSNTFKLAKPTLAASVFSESSECRYVLPEIGGLSDGPQWRDSIGLPDTAVAIPLPAPTTIEAIGEAEGTSRDYGMRVQMPAYASSPAARGLIEEYLAAKTRAANCQQQSSPLIPPPPPPIFHVIRANTSPTSGVRGVTVSPQLVQRRRTPLDELAYKHPILLLDVDDDENEPVDVELGQQDENKENTDIRLPQQIEEQYEEAGEQSSVSVYRLNDRQQSVEVGRVVNRSLDDDHDVGETNPVQESLIVPRPKVIAFHSLKSLTDDQPEEPSTSLNDDQHAQQQLLHHSNTEQRAPPRCRLVRKVNQNILKTWEQLSGQANGSSDGSIEKNSQQKSTAVTGDSKRLRVGGELVPPASTRKQCFFGQEFALFGRPDQTAASHSSSTGNLLSDGHGSECGSTDRQSCLLYCPQQQQYNLSEEVIEFKVNRLLHPAESIAASSAVDELEKSSENSSSCGTSTTAARSRTRTHRIAPSMARHRQTNGSRERYGVDGGSSSITTVGTANTITTATSSSEGADFYDSIDAVSSSIREDTGVRVKVAPICYGCSETVVPWKACEDRFSHGVSKVSAGTGDDLTSLDRKRLLWSIEID